MAVAVLLECCGDPGVLQECLDNELMAPSNVMSDDAPEWQVMTSVITSMSQEAFKSLIARATEGVENNG